VNSQPFADLSSIIALKDCGFVSVSARVNDWTVEMKAEDGGVSSVSWILLYRASLSGYRAAEYHQACDGMGKCVVVGKAENERIAAAYNEHGVASDNRHLPNLNGCIVSVAADGGVGEVFYRNDQLVGVMRNPLFAPAFGTYISDLFISESCHQNVLSSSILGNSYGSGPRLDPYALFGQENFRVVDYEVFKIVIE
jgi:hypothetical protein